MAQSRKYIDLPDIDNSGDIFESQAPTSDITTQQPESPSSSHTEASSESEASSLTSSPDSAPRPARKSRISRHGVSTSKARSHFASSRVDARDVDFSDRITDGRKSYRVGARKRKTRRRRVRRGEDGYVDEYEAGSEESEEETMGERIARLKREVEEVKAEQERSGVDRTGADEQGREESMRELGALLEVLRASTQTAWSAALSSDGTNGATTTQAAAPQPPTPQPPMMSGKDVNRVVTQATSLEARLTTLEQALGLPEASSIRPQQQQQRPPPQNIMDSMSKLESQLASLNDTTLPNLETMTSQIQRLTASASRLKDAREAAKAARDREPGLEHALTTGMQRDGERRSEEEEPLMEDDIELIQKIDALHSTLPSLSRTSPMVPLLLDRLKSLRVLHNEAATVSERFSEAEKAQARTGDEIERWRGALERIEGGMGEVARTDAGNREAVEAWVKDLEGRVGRLA